MPKKITVTLLVMFTLSSLAVAAKENSWSLTKQKTTLSQGFVIKAVDGTVSYDKKKNRWLFAADKDITDGVGLIKAGTKIPLLESLILQKITALYRSNKITDFRLWANTNYYNGSNSFYPIYFMTLQNQNTETDTDEQTDSNDKTWDTNSYNILPADILKKLQPQRIVSNQQIQQAVNSPKDTVLIGRTGFLFYDRDSNRYILKLDSLGRKICNLSFIVHRNQTLARAKYLLSKYPGPVRLRFSGRITKFEQNRYILLHSASIAYNNGNFGR